MHFAVLDFVNASIGDPLDVPVPHLAFQQTFGITDPAKAQMPDIGFGSHKGHRHFVADFTPLKFGIHDHREFISRAIARRTLHRPNHNRAGVFAEFFPGDMGIGGVINRADRLGEAVNRAKAGNFVKGQFGAGGDYQIVIGNLGAACQHYFVVVGVHFGYGVSDKPDALLFQNRSQIDCDV